ncbi:hypothetical protein [Desulfovibrio sp. ZJ369]|uniref:hypothetical protein n=1 Tax=Desulfovibrio sp. ZJ369 TaxID=2709793 RepID=UPI0013EC99E8|nr:hypothetical protein [Desulfovibrio sp. ZJ369]
MRYIINLLLLIAIFLCVVGCSPKFSVLVDGRTSQEYEQNKSSNDNYKIIFDNERNKYDFDYQPVYDNIVNIFRKNNYHIVENIYEADYVVFINFKVNGHTNIVNHSTPITGQVGVNTHTTYTYGPYGMTPHTYTTPKYGTIGYDNYQTTEISYTHLLSVAAYSFSKADIGLSKKVWEIILVTSDETNDFRKNLPALLLALEKHMATDTHGNIYIELYEKQGKLIEREEMFKQN